MKSKLIILCLLFSAVCSCKQQQHVQQRRVASWTVTMDTMSSPTLDKVNFWGAPIEPGVALHRDTAMTLFGKLPLGMTRESDYTVGKTAYEDSAFSLTRLTTWGFIKDTMIPTEESYFIQESVYNRLWGMNRKGKTLYIDSTSTSANRIFKESDTIKVAGKVFVAQRKPVNAIDSIFMYYW